MAARIRNDEFVGWFSYLFRAHTYAWIIGVSLAVSLVLFLVGYGLAVLGGLVYPQLTSYVGFFAVFGMLTALGIADASYTDVWNQVRHAFDVDDDAYRASVCPGLARIHDERRILAYATALAIPYFYAVTVAYWPLEWPLRAAAIEVLFGGELTYTTGVHTVVLVWLFGGVSAILVATIVNGFIEHVLLVAEISRLPFRDIHTTAVELEPLALFSLASATAWFAGISLIIVWIYAGIGATIGAAFIAVLVVTGIVFFSAPLLVLHDALVEAKHARIVDIRREYQAMHDRLQASTEVDDAVPVQLDVTDRRLESAMSIDTWVYNLSALSKLLAAAVIPVVTLIQELSGLADFV